MDRRLITPAEATVLLAPRTGTASKCIQAGLLSLLGAGRVTFEEAANPLKQSSLLLARTQTATEYPLPGHLVALEKALLDYSKERRLVASQVLHALQKRFGVGFGR